MQTRLNIYAKAGDSLEKNKIDELMGKIYPPFRWMNFKEEAFKMYLDKLTISGPKTVGDMKKLLSGKR